MQQVGPVRSTLLLVICTGTSVSLSERLDVPSGFPDIQAAIDAASAGDEIVVAPGSYQGTFTINKPVLVRSSDGPETTTLLGNGAGPVVVMDAGGGEGGTLAGFTVTGGVGSNGGGLFLSGDVAVIDCIVTENSAQNGGGAFLAGTPLLSEVRFEANTAHTGGAIAIAPDADALLESCRFTGNSAQVGGAVFVGPSYSLGTFAEINAGTFEANTADHGGGVMATMSGVEIDQSTFLGNIAWSRGGAVNLVRSAPSTVTGSRFTRNETDGRGGGIRLADSSDLFVAECQIDENLAALAGGGFDVDPASVLSVASSTLWGNQPTDIEGDWDDLGQNSFEQPPLCGADLAAPFGVIDMSDILAFVSLFSAEDDAVDFAAPEGLFDLADVIAFVDMYFSGCAQ